MTPPERGGTWLYYDWGPSAMTGKAIGVVFVKPEPNNTSFYAVVECDERGCADKASLVAAFRGIADKMELEPDAK